MSRPMMTVHEMAEHREYIRPVFESFLIEWDKRVQGKAGGNPSPKVVEFLIEESIKLHPKPTKQQYDAVQAFFDSFIGAFRMGGVEMSMQVAKTILVDELIEI